MILQIILFTSYGLCIGLLIGFINRRLIVSSVSAVGLYPEKNVKRKLYSRLFARYALSFLAFLLTYRWLPALIGAALGLLIMQKTLIVHYISLGKGVKK